MVFLVKIGFNFTVSLRKLANKSTIVCLIIIPLVNELIYVFVERGQEIIVQLSMLLLLLVSTKYCINILKGKYF